MTSAESFPVRQLTAAEQTLILDLCGGEPVDRDKVRSYLNEVGKTALGGLDIRGGYIMLSARTCAVTGSAPRLAAASFYRGVLFYSAVSSSIGSMLPEPAHHKLALGEFAACDPEVAAAMAEARITYEQGAFCGLAQLLREGLGKQTGSDTLHPHVLIGAGFVHLATVRSFALHN